LCLVGALFDGVAESYEFDAMLLLDQRGKVLHPGDSTAANDANLEFIHEQFSLFRRA